MQLNRLAYNTATGKASKTKHVVPIEQTIYPDRFMFKNREKIIAMEQSIAAQTTQIKNLEACLKQYT